MEIPDDLVRKYRYTYINDTLRIIDELVKPKKVHPNLYTPEFIPSFDLSFFLLMSHIEVSDKVSEPLYVANDSIKPERQNYMLFHKAPNITLHDGKQYISSPIKVILPNRKNYKYKVLGRFVNNEFLLDSICIKEKFRKKYSQEIDDALSQVKKRKFSFIEKNNYLMIEYLYTKGVLKIKKKKLVGRDISFYQL
ncbi:hypothetical protein [Flammeovirga aprica]|uniref:Uncharacterized protein n=1 Tax=Flammeovirga aprica JL-4 TaxID=694437 RepID=A0A7X9XC59_9BACT|nr:hypothetical protein [Flammeovirga aprica]NME71410.1 hypothetical protein [Flammeovirga aprica JL-4]